MVHIGQEIRRVREERGLNQTQLAVVVGTGPAAISRIENGRQSPELETLEKIARALDVEMADLFPKEQSRLPFEDGERRTKITGNVVDINAYELEKAIENLPPDYPVDNFIASVAEDMERRLHRAAEELRGHSA